MVCIAIYFSVTLLDDNSKPISFVLDGGKEVTLVLDIQFASL